MTEKTNEEESIAPNVPENEPTTSAEIEDLYKESPVPFSIPPTHETPILQAQVSDEPISRGEGSSITVLIDDNVNWPYAFGWVLVNNKWYMLDAKGCGQIPHSGSVTLEIWSENHAVRVVDGQNAILYPFIIRYNIPRPGSWSCPIKQQQWGFYVAAAALRPYLFLQRNVSNWGWKKIMARLVYPDGLFPESLCEPKSIVAEGVNKEFNEKPLIHIKDHGNWALIEKHVIEEYSHAVHFLELTVTQRHEVTWKYIGWLVKELLAGRDMRHYFDKRTDEMIAYLEGWDAYFTNKILPGDVQFQESTVINSFRSNQRNITAGDGVNWEVCIAALLHQTEKKFGFSFVWERYAKSRAITYFDFKNAWQREVPSSYAWLVSEAPKWQLPA